MTQKVTGISFDKSISSRYDGLAIPNSKVVNILCDHFCKVIGWFDRDARRSQLLAQLIGCARSLERDELECHGASLGAHPLKEVCVGRHKLIWQARIVANNCRVALKDGFNGAQG